MKTKRTLTWLLAVVTLFSLLSFNALAQDNKSAQTKHEPITRQLITMVEHDSEIKKMLIKSIEIAKKINPNKITNPAQTLEEYYAFIDWA
ncbi:MAG: phosphatidylserine decarboxylase, partial [Syntrophales bacterium]